MPGPAGATRPWGERMHAPDLLLLDPTQMALADRAAIAAGIAGETLMARAGWAVARAIAHTSRPCRVLVLCGPGNNGGDGYVVARLLAQRGWPVSLAALAPPIPGGDAALHAARWHGPMAPFGPDSVARADLVVDAIFGAGLARPVDGLAAATLAAARRVVAVDIPSGIDGATGAIRGFAPACALTISFGRPKPGHLLLPGRQLCGQLLVADIGLPESAIIQAATHGAAAPCHRNAPGLWALPLPDAADHKHRRGHVTILGGAAMPGAARLAAAAARRAGAGMVSIAAIAAPAPFLLGDPGLIVTGWWPDALPDDAARRVWVCGPGLGIATAKAALARLISAGMRILADADALSACAGRPDLLRGATILTPHAAEFARVFGPPGENRLAATRAAAAQTGAVVLLKGADTIIAAPDGRAAINDNAPPWLATAGSGDVLSGLIAALLAQGMEPFAAACAGAWLHGDAGRRAGPHLIAEDLPPALPAAAALAGHPATGLLRALAPI